MSLKLFLKAIFFITSVDYRFPLLGLWKRQEMLLGLYGSHQLFDDWLGHYQARNMVLFKDVLEGNHYRRRHILVNPFHLSTLHTFLRIFQGLQRFIIWLPDFLFGVERNPLIALINLKTHFINLLRESLASPPLMPLFKFILLKPKFVSEHIGCLIFVKIYIYSFGQIQRYKSIVDAFIAMHRLPVGKTKLGSAAIVEVWTPTLHAELKNVR
jgi:hypothetical protein